MNFRLYVAGPITGFSYENATSWRDDVAKKLEKYDIAVYSPMRAKEFLAGTPKLHAIMDGYQDPMTSTKGIVCRDHQDCVKADVLFVNFLGATEVSLGTACELAWAYDRRIPIVVVAEPENIHVQHPFVVEMSDFIVRSIDEGLRIVKHILLPNDPVVEQEQRTKGFATESEANKFREVKREEYERRSSQEG